MGDRWSIALVAACALASAGCDAVFGVDRLYECPLDDDDCDQLVDAVDPCPADPGSGDDEDRDGVGDDCDPNIGLATDRLLEFDGFHSDDPRWMQRLPASWHVRNSMLVLDAGAVERAVATNSQPTVELVAEPRFVAEGDIVGVYVASKASTGILLECRIEHHAAGDDLVMLLTDPATDMTLVEIGRAAQLPGDPRDGLRIYGGQLSSLQVIRCRARYGSNDALYVDWESFGTAVDFDTVGVRVLQQATASYHSVTIFTTVR